VPSSPVCHVFSRFLHLSTQVKTKPWECRLVDESYGSNVPSLLKKASELEVQYLKALPKPGEQNFV